MHSSVIKRNYLYLTLLLLKAETSEDGTHLSAKDIADHFESQYGVHPERKTIYTIMGDLLAMGFDIRLEKGKGNNGYYLGKREISVEDLYLLIDGIESIDNMKADDKQEIYDKLCSILGYSSRVIDSYIYDKRNRENETIDENEDRLGMFGSDLSMKDRLILIHKAIKENKQLEITEFALAFEAFMFEENDGDVEPWDDTFVFEWRISPYHLFRNRNDEICLLFYFFYAGRVRAGFPDVLSLGRVEICDEGRSPLPDPSFFPADLPNYRNAQEYLEDHHCYSANIKINSAYIYASMDFDDMKGNCQSCQKKTLNGSEIYEISYLGSKENAIEELILEGTPHIVPLPGSRLFERLVEKKRKLDQLFFFVK